MKRSSVHHVLVVGTGSIGERHVRCLLATGRAKVGICEVSDQVRDEVKQRYDVLGAYAGLEEALSESWDAAVVATPASSHISIALQLAKACVSLFIETPLSVSFDGVDELIKQIEQKGLIMGVALCFSSPSGSGSHEAIA